MLEPRRLAILVVLLLLAASAWRYRDAPFWREWVGSARPAPGSPARIEFENGSNRDATGVTRVVPRQAAGPRKCRQGERVVYTDGACPPGTKEIEIAQGTLNVVSMPRAASAAPAPASAPLPGMADRVVDRMMQPPR